MTARKSTKDRPPEQVTLKSSRYYKLADGTKLPSVTTVLQVLNKPALIGWASKTAANEAIANLPKLVRMCRTDPDGAYKWLQGSPSRQATDAANAGSGVHRIAEAHVLGEPYPPPDPATPAGQTHAQFIAWLGAYKPAFEATEAVVVNRTVGYAGSLDAICRIPALDNRLIVLDYKTGKTGPYPEWALQVAAYARGEEMWLPDDTRVDMPPIEGAAVLRLRPDAYALHDVTADLDALAGMFAHVLALSEWTKDAAAQPPFGPAVTATQEALV